MCAKAESGFVCNDGAGENLVDLLDVDTGSGLEYTDNVVDVIVVLRGNLRNDCLPIRVHTQELVVDGPFFDLQDFQGGIQLEVRNGRGGDDGFLGRLVGAVWVGRLHNRHDVGGGFHRDLVVANELLHGFAAEDAGERSDEPADDRVFGVVIDDQSEPPMIHMNVQPVDK